MISLQLSVILLILYVSRYSLWQIIRENLCIPWYAFLTNKPNFNISLTFLSVLK